MILEFLLVVGPSIVVIAIFFVSIMRGKRKPETALTVKRHISHSDGSLMKSDETENKSGLRELSNPDKQIEEIKKLILETTEKVKNIKMSK